jgi:hypothetical protein
MKPATWSTRSQRPRSEAEIGIARIAECER